MSRNKNSPLSIERNRYYDKYHRNPESSAFYHSAVWKVAKRRCLEIKGPSCGLCKIKLHDLIHHIKPIIECSEAEKIDINNLLPLCHLCHNKIHKAAQSPTITTAIGMPTIQEDENYYFDSLAADKPLRFIRKFCMHYEGKFAGQPFELLPWQTEISKSLFGWKRRSDNRRRFRELYLMSAKNSGKTPFLAAILFSLFIGEGEPSANVVSMASTFKQASLSFEAGRNWIKLHPELRDRSDLKCKQFVHEGPQLSKWSVIGGSNIGSSGGRLSALGADELHEFKPQTWKAFSLLRAELAKRENAMLIMTTNAPEDRSSPLWELHSHASDVLSGKSRDDALFPAIFEAPASLDWRSEEAAKAANPSLHIVANWELVRAEQAKGEARYRRLFLSQWCSQDDTWLDMADVRACCKSFTADDVKDLPLYIGIDPSDGDDVFAISEIYVSPKMFYVRPRLYLPRCNALKYEEKNLIPYTEWEGQGAITLLDEPTISQDTQERIAKEIIELDRRHKVQMLGYDRAYIGITTTTIEAAGIKCKKIGQGWGVTNGTRELNRRILERSITFMPNGCFLSHCENVRMKEDDQGNYWPVKKGSSDNKYAGIRAAKIDSITALVTGLVLAREHNFPKPIPYIGSTMVEI